MRTFLIGLWLLPFCTYSAAVWKVTSDNSELYIGGTIHLLTANDFPLPDQYENAYKQASHLVFETDIDTLNTEQFQKQFMLAIQLEPPKSLISLLSPGIYKELELALKTSSMSPNQFMFFKPAMAVLALTNAHLAKNGFTQEGVDSYFHSKAKNDQKAISWLESPNSQIKLLSSMGMEDPDAFVSLTLRDIQKSTDILQETRRHWLRGDMVELDKLLLTDLRNSSPALYDQLIARRNEAWLSQIIDMLETSEVEFVLVGALHLAGKESVLLSLEQAGFDVQKVD